MVGKENALDTTMAACGVTWSQFAARLPWLEGCDQAKYPRFTCRILVLLYKISLDVINVSDCCFSLLEPKQATMAISSDTTLQAIPPGVAQGSEWDVPLDLGSITSTWRLEDCGKYKLPGNWVKQMMECNIIVQPKRTLMYICKCPKRPKILQTLTSRE